MTEKLNLIQDEIRILDVAASIVNLKSKSNNTFTGIDRINDLKTKFKNHKQELQPDAQQRVSEILNSNTRDIGSAIGAGNSEEEELIKEIFESISVSTLPDYDPEDDDFIALALQTAENINTRKKRNVIFTGKPGVGKTHQAESILKYLKENDFPGLGSLNLLSLKVTNLVKDTQFRGALEKRLAAVQTVFEDRGNLIFIDEMQQLFSKSGNSESEGIVNALRTVLAGTDKAIVLGTCLESSYKKLIKDYEDMERRFTQISLHEPSADRLKKIINSEVVKLSNQSLSIDANVDVARFAARFRSKLVSKIYNPDAALTVLDKAAGISITEGVEVITLEHLCKAASTISGFVPDFFHDNKRPLLDRIENHIRANYVGQEEAVKAVLDSVSNLAVNISNPKKPAGVYIFLGSAGLGKTHLVQLLGEGLFGEAAPQKLIILNGGELSSEMDKNKILGSAAGYVGYGDKTFCDDLRENPNCIILLDEIEKAHPSIYKLFFKALGEGYITDAQGVDVPTNNALVYMTSNIGVDKALNDGQIKIGDNNKKAVLTKSALNKALKKFFPQSFLSRVDDVITFEEFTDQEILDLIKIELNILKKTVEDGAEVNVKFMSTLAAKIQEDIQTQITPKTPFDVRMINKCLVQLRGQAKEQILDGKVNLKFKYEAKK
jgi:ATP-dependent Clp protease ATP-binding subunit ClpA